MKTSIFRTFLYLSIGCCFFSCNDEIFSEELPINKVYVFDGSYVVMDLNLYLGEHGLISDFDEKKALEFWPNIQTYFSDTIIIKEQLDSLIIKSKLLSPVHFQMYEKNDSIFILRNDESYSFFSTLANNDDELITHLGFYIVQKPINTFDSNFSRGSDFELQSYKKRFYKNGLFESPIDMANKDDLVAWCNVYYKFKKVR